MVLLFLGRTDSGLNNVTEKHLHQKDSSAILIFICQHFSAVKFSMVCAPGGGKKRPKKWMPVEETTSSPSHQGDDKNETVPTFGLFHYGSNPSLLRLGVCRLILFGFNYIPY